MIMDNLIMTKHDQLCECQPFQVLNLYQINGMEKDAEGTSQAQKARTETDENTFSTLCQQ